MMVHTRITLIAQKNPGKESVDKILKAAEGRWNTQLDNECHWAGREWYWYDTTSILYVGTE